MAGVPDISMPVGGCSTGFVCTGRRFKLECKLRFASVRSSDELVLRVSPPDPDSCQMVLAQGLLMVRRPPLRCVHACVVARARHSRVSLRNGPGPLRRIICSLRSPLTFRDESCAAPSRSLDSRKSGHIRPTQTFVQASVWPEAQGKQTIAPSLLTTLAGCAPPRARPHHRFSTVENRSHHHPTSTCVQASVRPETQGKQTACNIAPSLADTLAGCAPPRARPRRRFSTVENRSHHHLTPTCVQASVTGNPR